MLIFKTKMKQYLISSIRKQKDYLEMFGNCSNKILIWPLNGMYI